MDSAGLLTRLQRNISGAWARHFASRGRYALPCILDFSYCPFHGRYSLRDRADYGCYRRYDGYACGYYAYRCS